MLEWSPFSSVYETFRAAITVELCIAAIALIWPRIGWFLLTAIYVVFLALLGKLVAAGAESCGCLGSTITIKPWQMMAIDGVILALLLWSRPWKRLGKTSKPLLRVLALAPIFVIALYWPKVKFNEVTFDDDSDTDQEQVANEDQPEELQGDFYMFDPITWEGQVIYDIDLMSFGSPPGSMDNMPSPALVVLYRKSCEHCQQHIADLAMNPPTDKAVVLVRVPEKDDASIIDIIDVKPDGAIEFELQELPRGYGIATPTSFEIDMGFMINNVQELEE